MTPCVISAGAGTEYPSCSEAMKRDTCAGKRALCQPEDTLCAPCGAVFTGPSVALTFSYDFFEEVVLHTEYEVCLLYLVQKGMVISVC